MYISITTCCYLESQNMRQENFKHNRTEPDQPGQSIILHEADKYTIAHYFCLVSLPHCTQQQRSIGFINVWSPYKS